MDPGLRRDDVIGRALPWSWAHAPHAPWSPPSPPRCICPRHRSRGESRTDPGQPAVDGPYWLWLTERGHSPWYPSLRLFRPKAWGDWTRVLAAAAASLLELVAATPR